MAELPFWPRMARPWLLMALALGVSGPLGRAQVVVFSVQVNNAEEKSKAKFPPDVESKFAKFMAKLKEAKRKIMDQRMEREFEDIAKATGLTPEGRKALDAPAQQVIDICLEDWLGKTEEMFRGELHQPAAMLRQVLDMMMAQADAYARQDMVGGYVQPTEHAKWAEALKRAFTPEQAAAWEKVQTERRQAFDKEMGDYMNRMTENAREQYSRSILGAAADIKRALGLSGERAAELDRIAKEATDKSAAEWRERAEKMFLQMEDSRRRQLLKVQVRQMGQIFLGFQSDERPDQQAVWKDGLARLLSADERKILETTREERRSRRLRAMGMLLVAELDEKAAFTETQRQRLQPLATRMVNDDSSLFSENESPFSISFNLQAFLTVGAKAKEEEMKEILDPIQWRHWQEACGQKNADFDPENDGDPEDKTADPGIKPRENAEPEDIESAVSDFLYDKTIRERNRMLPTMILKAEDAARVAQLSPDAVGKLETAARGASDQMLGVWKLSADQWVHSVVRDANGQNVRQRLRGIEPYNMPNNNSMEPEKEAIWTVVVKAELTPAQMAAWTKAVDERTAYRNRAIALAVLAEFDRRIPLTAEQWEKLEPMITSAVNDYAPEISTMFGNPNFSKWYMQPFSIFIPFAAAPEKDLKDILGKEEWERWTGNPEFANSRSYWTNIQQMHSVKVKAPR